jgi:ATP phosphoribosyltransferase regulatory subunit
MSAWVLPDHIADVLPAGARHIEELRYQLLSTARRYGYELVIPPLLEHLESLLTGAGEALDLQTFKLVDQLSGRMMGLRADSTPQVARMDAHLLNRAGISRLCYCGPVVHTRPDAPHATREPLQFGAEIYGHASWQADLEILSLACDCLQSAQVASPQIDLADAQLVHALLAGHVLSGIQLHRLHVALAAKDKSELLQITRDVPERVRQDLLTLVQLYGDESVLLEAEKALQPLPAVHSSLQNLKQIAQHIAGVKVTFDLADLRGYDYYTGICFAIYAPHAHAALARGGRYDAVGAVFGRNRPAAGFSMDLKALVSVLEPLKVQSAIQSPWHDDVGLRKAIAALRERGEIVVCVVAGQSSEAEEFHCDRELVLVDGQWIVQVMD